MPALLPRSLCVLICALGASGVAISQTTDAAPAASPLSANLTLTTHYKFRGQDQNQIGRNGLYQPRHVQPALQGGFDHAFGDSGFYVGNWNSNVDWLAGNSVEMDFYGGYRFKGGPIDWDVGALTYVYPGNRNGNTTELYGAGTYTHALWGAFTVKYAHTVSRDYFGYAGAHTWTPFDDPTRTRPSGRHTGYLSMAYSRQIMPSLTLKAAVGYTRMSSDIRAAGYPSYVDYSLGASYDFGGGLSLTGSVQGANRKNGYRLATASGPDFFGPGTFASGASQSINQARFVLALSQSF